MDISNAPGAPSPIDGTAWRRWLIIAAALFPLVALWSLANPLFASPDETTHMIRAQSTSVGDFSSPFTTDGLPIRSVECFVFQSEVSAACQDVHWGEPGTTWELPTENYPPVFYAIAAIPAVFTSGIAGAYLMRLWLAALCVALVAWAGVLVTRPGSGPWRLTGLVIAMTPMAVFTMATVNPSGLGVAFASLFVTGALATRTEFRRRTEVVAAVLTGMLGMTLVRRDGIIWLVLSCVVLMPLMPFRTVRSSLAGLPRWLVATATAVLILLIGATVLWAGPTIGEFVTGGAGGGTDAWEAARYVRTYVFHVIGTFGWLDSPIGEEPFLIAMIAAGSLGVLALVGSNRRYVASTALGIAALLLAPVGFGMVRFPYFQGRYLLPVWVCLALVAGASVAMGGLGAVLARRTPRFLLVVWAGVHLVGFVQNLRRYSVGRSGSWGFIFGGDWHPEMMSNVVAVGLFVASLVFAGAVVHRLLVGCGDGERPLAVGSDLFGEPSGHPVEDRPTDGQAGE